MFGIGTPELIVILVVALIVFGPERLPRIAAQAGKAIRDFRQMSADLTGELNRTLALDQQPEPPEQAPVLTQEVIAPQPAPASVQANGSETAAPALLAETLPAGDEAARHLAEAHTVAGAFEGEATPASGAAVVDGAAPPAADATETPGTAPRGEVLTFRPSADAREPFAAHEEPPQETAAAPVPETLSDAGQNGATAPPLVGRATPDFAVVTPTAWNWTPPEREPVDPAAAVTVRERVEAQVAAEAFRERRRRARYRRPAHTAQAR